jgi:hypothetical protein
MRLSPAQVTLLREAEHQFLGDVASRGVNYHIAMEEFVEAVLKVVLPVPVEVERDPAGQPSRQ